MSTPNRKRSCSSINDDNEVLANSGSHMDISFKAKKMPEYKFFSPKRPDRDPVKFDMFKLKTE